MEMFLRKVIAFIALVHLVNSTIFTYEASPKEIILLAKGFKSIRPLISAYKNRSGTVIENNFYNDGS